MFPYDSRALEPKLWNTFTRLTLVSKQLCERVTLDVDLAFFTWRAHGLHLDDIAIAEVKMERGNCHSPFMRADARPEGAPARLQQILHRGWPCCTTG